MAFVTGTKMCVLIYLRVFLVAYLRDIYIYLYIPYTIYPYHTNDIKPVLPRGASCPREANADAADIYRPFSIARSPRTGAAEALK